MSVEILNNEVVKIAKIKTTTPGAGETVQSVMCLPPEFDFPAPVE